MDNILQQIKYDPAAVKGGYTDHILNVDLDQMNVQIEALPPEFKTKYIGGRGYAIKLIWDRTGSTTRSDSHDNLLVMAGGPLCCEPGFPGTGKFIVGTISPLTDTFVDSNVGGHFAPLLKLAGFDAIVVSGITSQEVILIVDADAGRIQLAAAPVYAETVNAGSLSFGEALLKDFNSGGYNDCSAAVTAGKGACHSRFGIINSLYYDRRRKRLRSKQAGRGGTGTVMRQKGLRAVLVRSSLPKANANKAICSSDVRAAGGALKKVLHRSDPQQLHLGAWGTTILSEYMNKFHLLPIHNYQSGQSPDSHHLFADVFLKKYFSQKIPDGCYYGCNLACAKGAENVELTRGPMAGRKVGVDGPEYETVGAVSCMGIFDPHFVMEYNWYCDEYGLDSISTGVTISFFMECVQRGYLDAADIGYDLQFGDVETADRLLHEIGGGTGFGPIAGQGVARGKAWVARQYAAKNGKAAQEVEQELSRFAMEVKGLEFSMYISKESLAQQGGYGFALKGPQHDEAWLIFIDQVHKELPTFKDKAHALKWFPLIRTWFNATGLCKLPWIDVRHPDAADTEVPAKNTPTLDYYVKYYNATTGSHKTLEDMLTDSERLYVLQKLINVRQGKGTRDSDQIPLRAMAPAFFNEYQERMDHYDEWLADVMGSAPLPEDPRARHRLLIEKRQEAYQQLCDTVYAEKGFDAQGVPTADTVASLGLLDAQAEQLLNSMQDM